MYTYPRTHVPTYPRTHVPTYPRTHVPTYPRTHVPTYPRTHVPTYPRTHVPTYPRTHVPTYPRTHVPTYPRGYALVEVLLAFFVLGLSALLVGYLLSQPGPENLYGKLGSSQACTQMAHSILQRVKDQGLSLSGASYLPERISQANQRHPRAFLQLRPRPQSIPTNTRNDCPDPVYCPGNQDLVVSRWTQLPDILDRGPDPGDPPGSRVTTARPALLINGIMNDLQALYNSDRPNFCLGNGVDYRQVLNLEQGLLPDPEISRNLQARLKIQTYNINNLQLLPCPNSTRPPLGHRSPLQPGPGTGHPGTRSNRPTVRPGIFSHRHSGLPGSTGTAQKLLHPTEVPVRTGEQCLSQNHRSPTIHTPGTPAPMSGLLATTTLGNTTKTTAPKTGLHCGLSKPFPTTGTALGPQPRTPDSRILEGSIPTGPTGEPGAPRPGNQSRAFHWTD